MEKNFETYAKFMKALSDETRVKIFSMLSKGELCACKLLEEFHITQPTLSYHMKALIESGLVNGRKDGKWMRYTIDSQAFGLLKSFFGDIDADLKSSFKE